MLYKEKDILFISSNFSNIKMIEINFQNLF